MKSHVQRAMDIISRRFPCGSSPQCLVSTFGPPDEVITGREANELAPGDAHGGKLFSVDSVMTWHFLKICEGDETIRVDVLSYRDRILEYQVSSSPPTSAKA